MKLADNSQGELFSGTVDFQLLGGSVLLAHLASPALEEDLVYGFFFNEEAYAMAANALTGNLAMVIPSGMILS